MASGGSVFQISSSAQVRDADYTLRWKADPQTQARLSEPIRARPASIMENFRVMSNPTKFPLWDAHPVSVPRLSMPLAAAPSPPSWSPQPR